ncbi:tyrosine-type recombinase/integrase (plasmid) [Halobaculum sp. CBA1158]|uniref:tyrosine-type recombinase/integrase n=1 Tax=Halobaculum sp. CBA1158 TaxID=2904243 RepID=UPI001F2ED964|nr:tyrosine-type recombinase/integrase [Halobaculum sp. CBA1158]UIP01378.1 tyrosine-type recombinase/integrase [Halobaculum sp. CBA1158]
MGTTGSDRAGRVRPCTTLSDAFDAFVASVSKGDSGRHRGEVERVVGAFVERVRDRGVREVADLGVRHLEEYAGYLARRAWAREEDPNAGITGRTAHQYYALVRSFCTYLVERDALESNPAKSTVATDALPEESVGVRDDGRRQFWSSETREAIVRWMDWRTEDALDNEWLDAERATRDRALVAVLAYSGARGAELFRDPQNDRRRGLRWRDVDLDAGVLRVYGKTQEWQQSPLLNPGVERLRAHRRRQDPPSEEWPVFPTAHLPSLYDVVRRSDGVDEEPTKDTVGSLLREHDLVPPAISTTGARTLLKRLSAESGVTQDGEALLPHGARRGLGDELYDTSAELAQEVLRHQSVETTHASYRDDDVERLREAAEDALGGPPSAERER